MSITEHPAIRSFLRRHAETRPAEHPLAVFDCDYTLIQGDIGEVMFYRQIREFLFRISPADVWTDHPRRREIDRLFHTLSALPADARATHPAFAPFADLLLSWYFDQLAAGSVEKGCADIVRLFAGFTRDEVHAIADATFEDELATTPGTATLGTRSVPCGIRYIRESVELARALTPLGFSLWSISGSSKWSVEPVVRPFGIPRAQVIGIDLVESGGVFSADAEEPIPIRRGKIEALRQRTGTPPLLCASDSRNDIPLLQEAREVRVYLNSHGRDTGAFFATEGITADERWVVVEKPTVLEEPSRG
jgi:phosphoserine phosphatase